MANIIKTTILVSLCLVAFAARIEAKELESKDVNIIKNTENFNEPDKIILAPIYLPANDSNVNVADWYKGLFYYTIERLGFSDIPFHYVVSSQGDVYKANTGGEEQKIPLTNSSNALVIGYLSKRTDTEINPRTNKALGDLLVTLANKHGIKLENISVNRLSFTRNADQKIVTIEVKEIAGLWRNSLNTIISEIRPRYNPQAKSYSVEVSNVILPSKALTQSENQTVSVTIKNTGQNAIFEGSRSELYASKVGGGRSKFFLNNDWASQSEAKLMPEATLLKPGESKAFTFKLAFPLYFGEQNEEFVIRNGQGDVFGGTNFVVKVQVDKGNLRVVEITNSPIGYVRVRQNASTGSAEIMRLGQGERYIVIDATDNGWLKLDLRNGTSGWVSKTYTRNV